MIAAWAVPFILLCLPAAERQSQRRGILSTDPRKEDEEPDETNLTCPEVRYVLEILGLPSWEMPRYDQRNWTGVVWAHQFQSQSNYDIYDTFGPDECDVVELHFQNYPLRGHLSSRLANGPNFRTLRRLTLGNTGVTGNIGFLAGMRHLQALDLSSTAVDGDVGFLSHLPALSMLDLSRTGVYGKISDMRSLYSLRSLSLARTDVGGDLGLALLRGSGLYFLDLSRTAVYGDLGKLPQLSKELRKIRLSKTGITGDIDQLLDLEELRVVDLSYTKVFGIPSATWSFKLAHLHSLSLAGTQVRFIDPNLYTRRPAYFLTRIQELDVTGCPLNGRIEYILELLRDSVHLARLRVARTNLTGKVDDGGDSGLSTSLLLLDATDNNITHLTGFPGRSIVQVSLSKNHRLDVTKDALVHSLQQEIQLDLRGTLLANVSVVQELFAEGYLARTHEAVAINSTAGYYCYGITSETLRITPELFFPAQLCACLPGYKGSGTNCVPCEANTYNDMNNQSDCMSCPRHSETLRDGASALRQCLCIFGRIAPDMSSCACESGTAWNEGDLGDSECLKCEDFKLDCEKPGHTMFSAPPEVGYARVKQAAPRAFRCGEPAERRCNHSNASDPLGCAAGYSGPLCTTCGDGYRRKHNLCTKCADADGIKQSRLRIAAGILVLAVAGAATVGSVVYWRRSSSTRPSGGIIEALRPLVRVQMSVLLQFGQLWGVLAALSVNGDLWEEEYVQWLQLTTSSLQDAFSLECSYGADARFYTALAGPLVPLVLLLLCALLETVSRSMGVRMALRLLPFLFIGGASSCARLLSCQHYDAGDQALGEDAFLTLLPHLACRDGGWQATVAGSVGWISIVGYVIIIPGFLLYLMSKQKIAIVPSKRSMATAELGQDMAVVRLHAFQAHDDGTEPDSLEKEPRLKHLLAAAVAHSAVYFRGTVSFQLHENQMMQVRLLDPAESQDVENASSTASIILRDKEYTDQRRWIKITRMLTERCVFQDAEKRDRILAGADRLFCKYVLFELVWFEVVLKLVSAAFVSVVDSDDAPTLCAGVALVTATTLASFQPYVQRQANDLHSFCFVCLAASAAGFVMPNVWVARCGLALPFLLAFAQTLRPDGPESLALRLYEVAEQQLPEIEQGGAIELFVATERLL
eukprot:s1522_g3.t1